MKHRYQSRRATRRLARRSRRNFLITIIGVILLAYFTLTWVLPYFIGSVSFVQNIIKPPQKKVVQTTNSSFLAPPVLNISYEATNSAQIDIRGYGTPGSKVKLYMDDDSKQTIDVSSDGSFNFENVTLSLGTNNIYGKALDDQDKESLPSKTIQLMYINGKPSLDLNEPEDGKKIQGGDKKVKVSGKTDPKVKIFINDTQVIVDKDGNFSADQPLNDGDNTISIKAVDIASNTTEEQRRVNYSQATQ